MQRYSPLPLEKCMHVCGNNVNDTMTSSTVRVLQEGKAGSDENSLYVLGSLADLQ
jgi:hypothetical protein